MSFILLLMLSFAFFIIAIFYLAYKISKNNIDSLILYNPEEVLEKVNFYIDYVFQTYLITKLTRARIKKETLSESEIDSMIEHHSLKTLLLIPDELKKEMSKTFSNTEDFENFLIELIIYNLRNKLGGIK